ncbi:putative Two-component sensor kinase CzcS [Anopheles sinensis]|uniref:Putative Two-component sensor kinase CzcS n=1 Tax=Anopheles sinensis TaxID=74873 RepID=A0A084W0X9_ANOSI|nr:putative Two-component sensor kinase CzcS [Anopheles sinensis]
MHRENSGSSECTYRMTTACKQLGLHARKRRPFGRDMQVMLIASYVAAQVRTAVGYYYYQRKIDMPSGEAKGRRVANRTEEELVSWCRVSKPTMQLLYNHRTLFYTQ